MSLVYFRKGMQAQWSIAKCRLAWLASSLMSAPVLLGSAGVGAGAAAGTSDESGSTTAYLPLRAYLIPRVQHVLASCMGMRNKLESALVPDWSRGIPASLRRFSLRSSISICMGVRMGFRVPLCMGVRMGSRVLLFGA